MMITTKENESSSVTSSSYTSESLANEVTKKILSSLTTKVDEDTKIFIYRQIRDTIELVAKDILADFMKKQRVCRMSIFTDLEKILKKLAVT